MNIEMRDINTDAAEISIIDLIGKQGDGSGVTARKFADDFKKLGSKKEIAVRIHSRGGDVIDGLGIYETLRNSKAKVTTYIDGVAASMGSIIAMAGSEIVMSPNSLQMLHDPEGAAYGRSDDLRQHANLMDKMRDTLAGIYAERTQTDIKDVREMMSRTTWLSAQEAKAIRFADRITDSGRKAAACFGDSDLSTIPDRFRGLVTANYLNSPSPAPEPAIMANDPVTPNPAPVTPAPVAPVVAAAPAVDVDKIKADAVAEAKAFAQKIADKCKTAGCSDLAGTLMAECQTIESVLDRINAELIRRNPPAGGNTQPTGQTPADENQKYRDEFAPQAAIYAKSDFTVEDFIKQRRIEDGLDKLTKQPAAV